MEIEQLVDTLYEAHNGEDAAGAAALYAPGGRHVEIEQGTARAGPDAIREGLAGFFEAFPDARWRERTRVAAGERAAVTYVLTETLCGRLGPSEPASQRLDPRDVHVVEASGDKITLSEDCWDAATFVRQMRGEG